MLVLCPIKMPGRPGTLTPAAAKPGAAKATSYQTDGIVCGRCGSPASSAPPPATAGPLAAHALLSGVLVQVAVREPAELGEQGGRRGRFGRAGDRTRRARRHGAGTCLADAERGQRELGVRTRVVRGLRVLGDHTEPVHGAGGAEGALEQRVVERGGSEVQFLAFGICTTPSARCGAGPGAARTRPTTGRSGRRAGPAAPPPGGVLRPSRSAPSPAGEPDHQTGGCLSFHGRACSSWADREIRVPSSLIRPASITPIGKPSTFQCSGTFTAGWPDTL